MYASSSSTSSIAVYLLPFFRILNPCWSKLSWNYSTTTTSTTTSSSTSTATTTTTTCLFP